MDISILKNSLKALNISIDTGILAGGRGERMEGYDKGLEPYSGMPLVEHAIEQLRPLSFQDPIISCNRNLELYSAHSSRLVEDKLSGFRGPLAGIHALLNESQADYLVVFPCDTPLCSTQVAMDLVRCLIERIKEDPERELHLIAATQGTHRQPLHLVIAKAYENKIKEALSRNEYKIIRWLEDHDVFWLECGNDSRQFTNINTRHDLHADSSKIANSGKTGLSETGD